MHPKFYNRGWVQRILIFIFALPTLIHLYNLRYTRWMVDDYWYAETLHDRTLLEFFSHWYNSWTGSYSAIFLQGIAAMAGPRYSVWFLLPVVVTLWIGLIWVAYEASLLLQLDSPRFMGVFGGTVLMFTITQSLPNILQTYYWVAGAASHVYPAALLALYWGWFLFMLRRARASQDPNRHSFGPATISFAAMFVICGFSSLPAAFAITLIVLLLIAFRFVEPLADWRPAAQPILVAALLGATIALLITAIAPGTAIRTARQPARASIVTFAQLTAAYTISFQAHVAGEYAPLATLVLLLLGGLIAFDMQPRVSPFIVRHRWRLITVTFLLASVLIAACYSTIVYVSSSFLPERAAVLPAIIVNIEVIAIGYIVGSDLRSKNRKQHHSGRFGMVLVSVCLLVALSASLSNLRLTSDLSTYAREWDALHQRLLAADPESEIVIEPFTFDMPVEALLKPISRFPENNEVIADYYGVRSIRMRDLDDADDGE